MDLKEHALICFPRSQIIWRVQCTTCNALETYSDNTQISRSSEDPESCPLQLLTKPSTALTPSLHSVSSDTGCTLYRRADSHSPTTPGWPLQNFLFCFPSRLPQPDLQKEFNRDHASCGGSQQGCPPLPRDGGPPVTWSGNPPLAWRGSSFLPGLRLPPLSAFIP